MTTLGASRSRVRAVELEREIGAVLAKQKANLREFTHALSRCQLCVVERLMLLLPHEEIRRPVIVQRQISLLLALEPSYKCVFSHCQRRRPRGLILSILSVGRPAEFKLTRFYGKQRGGGNCCSGKAKGMMLTLHSLTR